MHSVDDDRRPRPSAQQTARERNGVLLMLAGATAIGSMGLAAGGTAGALLGAQLTHTSAGAGLPPGLLVVGSAAGALLIARQTARGRRGRGLMLGYLLGAVGAVLVVGAAVMRSLPLLLVGSTVLGTANSAIFMTRYATLDAAAETDRGRALGTVFFSTAVGAIVSPMLMGPSGTLAEAVGLPRLTGLYLVATAAFGVSALFFSGMSPPRVPRLGRGASVLAHGGDAGAAETDGRRPGSARGAAVAGLRGALHDVRTRLALAALTAGNFVMVGLMAVAPLHLVTHGSGLDLTGTLIALHVAGMFGPSPVSGRLADRFGATRVVLIGGVLLAATGGAGVVIDDRGVPAMACHLLVLGVGWNFMIVGGSALLMAGVPESLRPHAEGIGEVVMGVGAAVASPVVGVAAALGGYGMFSLAGTVVAIGVLVFARRVASRS